jgi:hypothetical protein
MQSTNKVGSLVGWLPFIHFKGTWSASYRTIQSIILLPFHVSHMHVWHALRPRLALIGFWSFSFQRQPSSIFCKSASALRSYTT